MVPPPTKSCFKSKELGNNNQIDLKNIIKKTVKWCDQNNEKNCKFFFD